MQHLLDRARDFWAELTAPCPDEQEYERMRKEREVLWRATDQMRNEIDELRRDLRDALVRNRELEAALKAVTPESMD